WPRAQPQQEIEPRLARGPESRLRFTRAVHRLDEDQIDAEIREQASLPPVLLQALVPGRHEVGAVAVFERSEAARHERVAGGEAGADPAARGTGRGTPPRARDGPPAHRPPQPGRASPG